MTSTPVEQDAASKTRQRGYGELIVDLVIVVGSAWYLWTAQSYPPAGRQIPTVIGAIALIVGAVQLVGWFVPGMWTLTHGNKAADGAAAGARDSAATPVEPAPAAAHDAPGPVRAATDAAAPGAVVSDAQAQARRQNRDTVVVVAWAAGFLLAILVLGYRYAVPVFFLAYFGRRKQWKLAIGSAVVMWALTQFVFIDLLNIHLPTSQFFVF